MNPRTTIHPRDEILSVISRIYRYRMTTTSGGNVSILDENQNVWITPARVDKGALQRGDIVCVKPDGTYVGPHPPSSELPFHQAIYRRCPRIRAIVHAHPVALVAFSICGLVPNTRIFHQAYYMAGQVGFAPYALPGSEKLGENIAIQFESGCDSVILENHGVVVGGENLSHAFQRFEAFEFAGKTLLKASRLGPVRYLESDQLKLAMNRVPETQTGSETYDCSNEERDLRRTLVEFLARGCRQRLLISTEGSFSARLDSDSFLITPSQRDREQLKLDDLVFVKGMLHEAGKVPSRAIGLHRAIYEAHSNVRAIVFAHPVNATAFSITDSRFDARTIPESYVFLGDVLTIPFGEQYKDKETPIAAILSDRHRAAIVENDGVVVLGSSILDAFDRLEVLETTAEAIINAKSLGPIQPMSAHVIEELKSAFNLD